MYAWNWSRMLRVIQWADKVADIKNEEEWAPRAVLLTQYFLFLLWLYTWYETTYVNYVVRLWYSLKKKIRLFCFFAQQLSSRSMNELCSGLLREFYMVTFCWTGHKIRQLPHPGCACLHLISNRGTIALTFICAFSQNKTVVSFLPLICLRSS